MTKKLLKNSSGLLFYSLLGFFFSRFVIVILQNNFDKNIILKIQQLLFYFPAIILATIIIVLISCLYLTRKIKQDNYNQEEDGYYSKHQTAINLSSYFCEISIILNFTVFGLNLTSPYVEKYKELYYTNTNIFFAVTIFAVICETLVYRLQKKVRPELNADMFAINYNNDAFSKLDEMEQKSTGMAAYKTISYMIPAFVFTIIFAFLLMAIYEIDSIIILPIGFLWFTQITIFSYHSNKKNKKQKKEKKL